MPRAIQARKMKGLLRGPSLFAARLGGLESIGRISTSLTLTPSLRASDGNFSYDLLTAHKRASRARLEN